MRGLVVWMVAGVLLGFGLVLLGSFVLENVHHPLARQAWEPACWELTKPLRLGGDASGPSIPGGAEYAWDGELAWFTIYLEGSGFERCEGSTPRPVRVRTERGR